MGATLAQLASLQPVESAKSKGVYKLKRVPKPHEDFEFYMVVVSPKQGLCKVVGFGNNVSTSVYGTELRSAFNTLEAALISKYGNRKQFDQLRAGSIWDEPKDFMMGMLEKERSLVSFWDQDEGSTFTDHITAITLEAKALRQNVGFIELSYEFENTTACMNELKNATNSVL